MKNILKYILILCLLFIMICYPKSIPVLGENNTTLIFTFDDGPNGENTLEILDYLESHNMSATFFMVGNKMSSQKDLVKKVYNSNSEIGYHSYDHTLFTKNKIKNIIISIKYSICLICIKLGNAADISFPYCKFDICDTDTKLDENE